MSDPLQLLYLPLNDIEGNEFPDESGQNHPALAHGNIQMIPSDQLGAVVQLTGESTDNEYLSVSDPNGDLDFNFDDDDFTIEAWVDATQNSGGGDDYRTVILKGIANASSPTPYWIKVDLNNGSIIANRKDAAGGEVAVNSGPLVAGLHHVSMVRSGGNSNPQLSLYIDGEPLAGPVDDNTSNSGYTQNTGDVTIGAYWDSTANSGSGGAGGYLPGQLGPVRIYNYARSQAQIQEDILLDLSSISAYRRSHPFDIHLTTDTLQDVLNLNAGGGGQDVNLEVRNTSGQNVTLTAISGAPTSGSYHFALWFRPGVIDLSTSDLETTTDNWTISNPSVQTNGSVVYYLSTNLATAILAGDLLSVGLSGVVIETTGGTRETAVDVGYDNLAYTTDPSSPIIGSRLLTVALVNDLVQGGDGGAATPSVPLALTWTTGNQIITDGAISNDVQLLLRNTGMETLTFNPSTDETPTSIIVQFDEGDVPGGIGELPNGFGPTLTDWSGNYGSVEEGVGSGWTFTTTDAAPVAANETLGLIDLTALITESPAGQTNVYIKLINVPGFADTEYVTQLDKTPIRFLAASQSNNSTDGTLTIGSPVDSITVNNGISAANLAIGTAINTDFKLSIGASSTGLNYDTGSSLLSIESASATGCITLNTDGSERIRVDSTGNLGVGTNSPAIPLAIGESDGGLGYDEATTSLVFYRGGTQRMRIDSNGKVGIGSFTDTINTSVLLAVGGFQTGLGHPAGDTLAFYTHGSERMRLDSSGNLGIGTGSNAINSAIKLAVGGTQTGLGHPLNNTLAFYTGGTERLRIDDSGNVGIGTDSPGAQLDLGTTSPSLKIGNWTFALSGSNLSLSYSSGGEQTCTYLFNAASSKITVGSKQVIRHQDPVYIKEVSTSGYLSGTSTKATVTGVPDDFEKDTYWGSNRDTDTNLKIYYNSSPSTS